MAGTYDLSPPFAIRPRPPWQHDAHDAHDFTNWPQLPPSHPVSHHPVPYPGYSVHSPGPCHRLQDQPGWEYAQAGHAYGQYNVHAAASGHGDAGQYLYGQLPHQSAPTNARTLDAVVAGPSSSVGHTSTLPADLDSATPLPLPTEANACKCRVCGRILANPNAKARHESERHGLIKSFHACADCSDLRRPTYSEPNVIADYHCSICGHRNPYADHYVLHHPACLSWVDILRFKRPCDFDKHREADHGDKPTSIHRSQWRFHMDTPRLRIACDLCGQVFEHEAGYERHRVRERKHPRRNQMSRQGAFDLDTRMTTAIRGLIQCTRIQPFWACYLQQFKMPPDTAKCLSWTFLDSRASDVLRQLERVDISSLERAETRSLTLVQARKLTDVFGQAFLSSSWVPACL